MVSTITLERAIAEGATSGQMLAIAEWHDERVEALGKGKKPKDYKDYEHRLSHHRFLAKAMRKLAERLDAGDLEAAA